MATDRPDRDREEQLRRAHAETVAPVPPSVSALRQSLAAVIEEAQALRGDVHAAEQARRRANQINIALLCLLVGFVALLLVIGWQNNRLSEEVHKTNERMADCTTPNGVCYEENRKRTGEAVGDIIRAEIYMAQCARLFPGESGPSYDRKLEDCVYSRLAAATAARTANPTPTPSPTPSRTSR